MAFTTNNNIVIDKTDPLVLKSYNHANQLFAANQFALLPKKPFMFHVYFDINPAVLITPALKEKYLTQIGMLVRSINMPAYTVQTETLNQYNRPKVTQYKIQYGEATIMFHNDSIGVINELWRNYYNYYYFDGATADSPSGYIKSAMTSLKFNDPYGLKGQITPFFKSIHLYQMSRHEYVSYELINPILTAWDHKMLDYYSMEKHEFEMKIKYEGVKYGNGLVKDGGVLGFALANYDFGMSPLQGTNDSSVTFPIKPDKISKLDLSKFETSNQVPSPTVTQSIPTVAHVPSTITMPTSSSNTPIVPASSSTNTPAQIVTSKTPDALQYVNSSTGGSVLQATLQTFQSLPALYRERYAQQINDGDYSFVDKAIADAKADGVKVIDAAPTHSTRRMMIYQQYGVTPGGYISSKLAPSINAELAKYTDTQLDEYVI